MSVDRVCYWIAQLVDPREHDRTYGSLAFMPDTLILEGPDLCFFRASGRVPSECVVVGGERGPDTLDQTTVALQRVEDAATALTLVRHGGKYGVTLLQYGLDQLPEEFLPGPESFRQRGFARSIPLTEDDAKQVRCWYELLRGARARRNADATIEQGITLSIDALTTRTKLKYVLLYAAYQELCDLHAGVDKARSVRGSKEDRKRIERARGKAKSVLISEEDRKRIERARRPVAKGGEKAALPEDSRPASTLQAEATSAFIRLLRRFLEESGHPSSQ